MVVIPSSSTQNKVYTYFLILILRSTPFGAFLRNFRFLRIASERLVGWRPMETKILTSSVLIQPTILSFQDQ